MKKPILQDIDQFKKHILHVCGQECRILVKYLETSSLFLGLRETVGLRQALAIG